VQRLERREHRGERRRHAPPGIARREIRRRFSRDRRGRRAQRLVEPARAGDEVARRRVVRVQVDAARQSGPGIGARHLARRDLDDLVGAPASKRALGLGAAPRERIEHARVRARERVDRILDLDQRCVDLGEIDLGGGLAEVLEDRLADRGLALDDRGAQPLELRDPLVRRGSLDRGLIRSLHAKQLIDGFLG